LRLGLEAVLIVPEKRIKLSRIHSLHQPLYVFTIPAIIWFDAFLSLARILVSEGANLPRPQCSTLVAVRVPPWSV